MFLNKVVSIGCIFVNFCSYKPTGKHKIRFINQLARKQFVIIKEIQNKVVHVRCCTDKNISRKNFFFNDGIQNKSSSPSVPQPRV